MKEKVVYKSKEVCDICGCKDFSFYKEVFDFDTKLGSFNIMECQKCGMLYTSPCPTEDTLHFLYEARDSRNFDSGNNLIFNFLKDYFAKNMLKNYLKKLQFVPSSVVDFGTGNGRFANILNMVLPECEITAVDFNEEPPELVLNSGNISYKNTEEFFNNKSKYDVIFLRHVLEHSYNPIIFLKKLEEHLSERGVFIIEVPNIKNGITLLFGKYSSLFYPPYHIVHFTKNNIKELFEKLGYSYEFGYDEMPFMSNIIANLMNYPLDNKFRLIGIFLYPIQLLINFVLNSHTVINAIVKVNNK